MAFYYNRGNQTERIEALKPTTSTASNRAVLDDFRIQAAVSPTFDEENTFPPRRSTTTAATNTPGGRRRERLLLGETRRIGRPSADACGAPRRGDLRLPKLFGDSSAQTNCNTQQEPARGSLANASSDILFNSEGRVSYGTWRGLVKYLTLASSQNAASDFAHAFFLVFRSFATPTDFADALVARAREQPSARLAPAEAKIWCERVQAPIRHRVFLAIRTWYENYWCPTMDSPVLAFLCSYLLAEYLPTRHGSAVKECLKLLRKIEAKNPAIDLDALALAANDDAAFSVGGPGLGSSNPLATSSPHHDVGSNESSMAVSRDLRAASREHTSLAHRAAADESRYSGQDGAYTCRFHKRHRRASGGGIFHRLFSRRNVNHYEPQNSDNNTQAIELPPSTLRNNPMFQDTATAAVANAPANGATHAETSRGARQAWDFASDYDSSDDGRDGRRSHRHHHHSHHPPPGNNRNTSTPSSTDKDGDSPDITDLLMATVGMDLSLEAYRRTSHILQVSPVDVACQLTIIESSCYCQIMPHELLNKEFSRGNSSLATNVRQMTRWCTQITRWASLMILSELTPERRCRVLKYFIQLGMQLLALKNYDAVMAVKAAIFCAAVMRLKQTWSLLPKKFNVLSKRLHAAMDPDHNYANYRAILRRSQPPLLPFLGLYLTDLTFLEDGNPTYRRYELPDERVYADGNAVAREQQQLPPLLNQPSNPPSLQRLPSSSTVQLTGQTCALFACRSSVDLTSRSILINFEKSYKVAGIIMEIQKFQVEYSGNFTIAIPGLQQYLIEQWEKCEAEGYDDDKIYELSLKREPRAAATQHDSLEHVDGAGSADFHDSGGTGSSNHESANHNNHQSMHSAMRLTRLIPGAQRLKASSSSISRDQQPVVSPSTSEVLRNGYIK